MGIKYLFSIEKKNYANRYTSECVNKLLKHVSGHPDIKQLQTIPVQGINEKFLSFVYYKNDTLNFSYSCCLHILINHLTKCCVFAVMIA